MINSKAIFGFFAFIVSGLIIGGIPVIILTSDSFLWKLAACIFSSTLMASLMFVVFILIRILDTELDNSMNREQFYYDKLCELKNKKNNEISDDIE